MDQPARKKRALHFFIYLAAGASMGGFLDVVAFDQPTPVYGMIFGVGVAILYQLVWEIIERKRQQG